MSALALAQTVAASRPKLTAWAQAQGPVSVQALARVWAK
jgi:hypothetical protein